MARVAPTLYDFVEADNGDYLKVTEAVLPDLRPPGVAARQPRPRPDQGAGRQDRHRRRSASMVDEELKGDWVERARLHDRPHALRPTTRRPTLPPDAPSPRLAQRRPLRVRALRRRQRRSRSARRASRRSRCKVIRGDLTPEQFRGLGQIMRDYTGGYARTTVQQNFVLRWVRDEALYDVYKRLGELGLDDAGAAQITDVVSCPGTDSLQARHHQLDGPEPGGPGAGRGDEHHRPADPPDPHQDERLPERLQPAPHRQHRLLRRLAQGRRHDDARPTSPHLGGNYEGGEVIYGTRLKARLPAKRVPDAVERWICASTSPTATTARPSTTSSSGSAPTASRSEVKDLTLPVEFNLENHARSSSTGTAPSPTRSSAARASARSRSDGTGDHTRPAHADRRSRSRLPAFDAEAVAAELEDAQRRGGAELGLRARSARDIYIACSFQKTSSVTIHMATQINPEARFFYLDTDVLFPETYETRDRLAEHFGDRASTRYSNMTLEEQAGRYGDELWKRDPDACCGIRKVDPMRRRSRRSTAGSPASAAQDSQTRAKSAQVRLGQALQPLEAEPARRLVRAGRLDTTSPSTTSPTTRCTTRATPRSAAPTAPAAGRPGEYARDGPLGRLREDGVRHQLAADRAAAACQNALGCPIPQLICQLSLTYLREPHYD